MELANIEKLVEKYENAETTLQEEAVLRNYFTKEEVATHLQEYSYMFNYFATIKDEMYTKTIELEPKKIKKKNFKWLSVAASIVLVFIVFVGKNEYNKYRAEVEFEKISKGLKLISSNFKKAETSVATLYTHEDTVNKILK